MNGRMCRLSATLARNSQWQQLQNASTSVQLSVHPIRDSHRHRRLLSSQLMQIRPMCTSLDADVGRVLPYGKELRETEFNLEEGVAFCNSASRSCVPTRLIERQFELIRKRESDNQLWSMVTEPELIWESMEVLAEFIGADINDFTYIENATTGTNNVIKGQMYSPGDKILLSNQIYSATHNQAKVTVLENPGVELVTFDIPLPIRDQSDILDAYAKILEVHKQIKITVLDHITSSTCVVFPIKELVELCHEHGVLVVVDGAHAPGHIELSVAEYGADYYVGNLCKWVMLPQSAGFLWVHPKHQERVQPIITSHRCFAPHFRTRYYPALNRDCISQILVKDALEFVEDLGGLRAVTARNNKLATTAGAMLAEAWGTKQIEVNRQCMAPNVAHVYAPPGLAKTYATQWYADMMVDIRKKGAVVKPNMENGTVWFRVSCHVWNDWEDYEKLRDIVLELEAEGGVPRTTSGYYYAPMPRMN